MTPDDEDETTEPTFEEIVAAALKVDSEGIIGQRGKKKAENDESPAPE